MKKILMVVAILSLNSALMAAKTYTGYSWKGETKGETLEKASEKIETKLTLDDNGIIKDVKFDFLVKKGENWIKRNNPKAEVGVDFTKTPSMDNSMFTVKTADMMSFYAVAADKNGDVALMIVDPITRYQFEAKFDKNFNFNTPVKDMTIAKGILHPTKLTSSSGMIKIKENDFSSIAEKNIFKIHPFSHVLVDYGVFKGLTENSTIKDLLEKTGVTFKGNVAQATEPKYGFTANGGWNGNYEAIAKYLIGKNAKNVKSLIDWSIPRYAKAVSENKVFGEIAGATKTAQNSYDTISGATVRISRESTSYQRALVDAGIIKESEVVKGRF